MTTLAMTPQVDHFCDATFFRPYEDACGVDRADGSTPVPACTYGIERGPAQWVIGECPIGYDVSFRFCLGDGEVTLGWPGANKARLDVWLWTDWITPNMSLGNISVRCEERSVGVAPRQPGGRLDGSLIFADGFESGDVGGWDG
jgi:hypothetical protein